MRSCLRYGSFVRNSGRWAGIGSGLAGSSTIWAPGTLRKGLVLSERIARGPRGSRESVIVVGLLCYATANFHVKAGRAVSGAELSPKPVNIDGWFRGFADDVRAGGLNYGNEQFWLDRA